MENLLIDILEITLPISVWIAMLLLCAPLLKRSYVSKWRYYMWLFVSLRLVLPFKISAAKPITVTVPQHLPAAAQSAQAAGIDPMRFLALIWLAGVIIFVLYQTACYLSFSGIVRRWARQVTDERILAAVKDAKEFAGVKREIRVKTCKAASTPMVFGIIRPVLLLPCGIFTDSELAIILRHELVHIRRHDLWYKLLVMAARAVHWFNPLVHIMARAADADMELACDAEVVKNQNAEYRRGYCETIMRLVHNGEKRGTAISTCFLFSKKTIMERFYGILDEKIKRNGVVMFCVIAVSVAVSGGVITFATDNAAEVIEDDIGIAERTAPKSTPAAEQTPAPTASEPKSADYTDGGADTDYTGDGYTGTYTGADYDAENTYTGADYGTDADYTDDSYDSGYSDYSEPEYADGTETEVGGDLGEPESVSDDGSRETYTLDDGSTAIVRYDGDTPDVGYILVE